MSALLRSLRILRLNWKVSAISIFSLSIAMALGVICLCVSNTSLLVGPAGVAPEHLVTIYLRSPGKDIDHISYPDYQYYRENNHVFEDVAAVPEEIGVIGVGFGSPGQSQKSLVTVTNNSVSDNYFSVLGARGEKTPKMRSKAAATTASPTT
jgi:hypothetical protein